MSVDAGTAYLELRVRDGGMIAGLKAARGSVVSSVGEMQRTWGGGTGKMADISRRDLSLITSQFGRAGSDIGRVFFSIINQGSQSAMAGITSFSGALTALGVAVAGFSAGRALRQQFDEVYHSIFGGLTAMQQLQEEIEELQEATQKQNKESDKLQAGLDERERFAKRMAELHGEDIRDQKILAEYKSQLAKFEKEETLRQSTYRDKIGKYGAGNIDLWNRPQVLNPDNSISTVRSMSVNIEGMEILIPTVSQLGKIMADAEAVQEYLKTGQYLGKFQTVEEANKYAEALHISEEEKLKAGIVETRYTTAEASKILLERAQEEERYREKRKKDMDDMAKRDDARLVKQGADEKAEIDRRQGIIRAGNEKLYQENLARQNREVMEMNKRWAEGLRKKEQDEEKAQRKREEREIEYFRAQIESIQEQREAIEVFRPQWLGAEELWKQGMVAGGTTGETEREKLDKVITELKKQVKLLEEAARERREGE